MSRRFTGTVLIFTAAILYAAHYLSAAIFGSGVVSWDAGLFQGMLQYVGNGLTTWSLIALIAGVGYLIWAEVETLRGGRG